MVVRCDHVEEGEHAGGSLFDENHVAEQLMNTIHDQERQSARVIISQNKRILLFRIAHVFKRSDIL